MRIVLLFLELAIILYLKKRSRFKKLERGNEKKTSFMNECQFHSQKSYRDFKIIRKEGIRQFVVPP